MKVLPLVAVFVLVTATSRAAGSSSADSGFWELLWRFRWNFLQGTWLTILITVSAMVIATVFGLTLALARLYGHPVLSRLALGYVEVVRGTPLLVQLWFLYYGLPNIPWIPDLLHGLRTSVAGSGLGDFPFIENLLKLNPLTAAILGMGLNYAAYEAEIYRAGIMAIPRAQTEAGLALGFSKLQIIRIVIMPQAFRLVVPPVTNDFVALFKDTSIVSIVAVTELTKTFQSAALSTQRYMEFALVTAVIYFILGYPLSRFARHLEQRIHPHHDYGSVTQ